MKMILKQRLLTWFDKYRIYDENDNVIFQVEGKPDWGHKLQVYDPNGDYLGEIRQELFHLQDTFDIYIGKEKVGKIKKKLSLLTPKFDIDYNGWEVDGKWMEWNYTIKSGGDTVATVKQELLHVGDTYAITVENDEDALMALMVVLAIDADKDSRAPRDTIA